MHNCLFSENNFLALILDAAKLESTLQEMTVYTTLNDSTDMTVKFRINPVSNHKVSWFMGTLEVPNTNISSTEKGEHVQTTYSILDVTEEHLGSYTIRVINQAIIGEPNEAAFTVFLALKGENNNPCRFMLL